MIFKVNVCILPLVQNYLVSIHRTTAWLHLVPSWGSQHWHMETAMVSPQALVYRYFLISQRAVQDYKANLIVSY